VYSGAGTFFRTCASKMGIETSFVNMLSLEETEKSIKPNTKVNNHIQFMKQIK
jgi:O-acetylhomoserine/O-acetylserine sulfhydrylase-like pyridoxal-dependent enzyme